jgi:hypothetical protein
LRRPSACVGERIVQQAGCSWTALGCNGAIGPVVVVGAKVIAEIRFGSDREGRGEFVLAAGLAASGRALG